MLISCQPLYKRRCVGVERGGEHQWAVSPYTRVAVRRGEGSLAEGEANSFACKLLHHDSWITQLDLAHMRCKRHRLAEIHLLGRPPFQPGVAAFLTCACHGCHEGWPTARLQLLLSACFGCMPATSAPILRMLRHWHPQTSHAHVLC